MKLAPFILAACASLASTAASAQSFPAKPITMIVPSAPAGSTDIMARLVGEQLARAMGQPVIIDNKPGASGNIGTEAVARAAPDGYTLLMQYSGYHLGNPALFLQIRWRPTKDFAPVAMVMRAPHVIAVSGALPVTAEIRKVVESDAFRKKVDDQGAFATYMDPLALGKFVDQELGVWARVIKAADIKAE